MQKDASIINNYLHLHVQNSLFTSLQDAWGMLMIQTQDVTNKGIR